MLICWRMPKPWQLQEAQTLLIAHRLEEGTDLKKKTCSASLKHYLPIFLCARCCSGRETPDDLYGNRDELADTPRFSSPFSNNRTRLYQDTPQAPPPFSDILTNHLRESSPGKTEQTPAVMGVVPPAHRTLALQHV